MTREEAIKEIKNMAKFNYTLAPTEVFDMAIKALEQEPILDKIRAEIDEEADYAYADFDRYKEDILHAESDELPDDDYRYGLRRAIEIIDKYKRESEDKK